MNSPKGGEDLENKPEMEPCAQEAAPGLLAAGAAGGVPHGGVGGGGCSRPESEPDLMKAALNEFGPLRAEESERFRSIFEHAALGLAMTDCDGRLQRCNRAFSAMIGYSEEELRGRDFALLVHPEDREENRRAFGRLLERAGGGAFEIESRYVHRSGRPVWVHKFVSLLRDSKGRPNRVVAFVSDVTERRRREQQLAEQARLLELSNDAIIVRDGHDRITYWNHGAEALYGWSRQEALGRIPSELLRTEFCEPLDGIWATLRREGRWEGELVHTRKDGGKVTAASRWALDAEGGRTGAVLETNNDISARKLAESRLRESESRFRVLFEALPLSTFVIDPEGLRILDCNDRAASALGYSCAELRQMSLPDFEAAITQEEIRRNVARLEQGGNLILETRHRTRAGEIREVIVTSSLIRLQGRQLIYASALDVTESKRAQAALRKQLELVETLTNNSTQAIFMMDARGFCTFMNPAAEAMLGFSFAEIAVRPLHEMIHHHHPDGSPYPMSECPIDRALPENFDVREHEDMFIRKNGEFFPVLVAASPIFDEARRPVATVIEVRDVTERRRAERSLRESEERFRNVFESAAIGIGRVSLGEGCWMEVNGALCQMLGCSREELCGKSWRPMMHPEDADLDRAAFAQLARGELESYTIEKRFLHKAGRGLWMRLALSLVRDGKGLPSYAIAVIEDITERRRIADTLREAKEQAEAGNKAKDEFLATLSHELRTPLTPVLMLAAQRAASPELARDVREDFATIRANVQLEARLIDDMLDFSSVMHGKLRLHFEPCDVRSLMEKAVEIVRGDICAKGLELVLEHTAREGYASADAVRLQQVFWNLLKNAVKYTPRGGRVMVRISNPARHRLAVTVSDTGIGIAREALGTIFRPFDQGQRRRGQDFGGLGLGLAIAHAIVTLHHGTLTASSAGPGMGASFTVELDAVPGPASERPAVHDPRPEGAAPLRLLVVEDHAQTRRVLVRLLERAGHQVHVAGSVKEALSKAAACACDLVISDLGLPDGTGEDLMRQIKRTRGWPGIALSGFGAEADIASARAAGFQAHLTKPVDMVQLTAVIAAVSKERPGRDGSSLD